MLFRSGTTTGSVWNFTVGGGEETTAIAYWRLDETSGSTAYDSVGSSNGTLVNMDNSDWVSGMVSGALDFDGADDYVAIARSSVLETGNATTHELSVSAWVKSDTIGAPANYNTIAGTGDGGWLISNSPGNDTIYFACWLLNGANGQTAIAGNTTVIFDGDWHYIAGIYDGSSVHMYVDGTDGEAGTIGGTIRNMFDNPVLLGENAAASGRNWDGLIDDVKIYDYALSSEEIYHMQSPSDSWNPSPVDGVSGVDLDADLSWSAGTGATSHDVYFGQSSPGTFQGNQSGTTFDTGTMANDTTYYWRIDEVNAGGTVTGRAWSFTTSAQISTNVVFPGATWESKTPEELGCDSSKLSQLASNIGGNGIIVRQGYVIYTWGDPAAEGEWASAVKPLYGTMLFFATEENRVSGIHDLIGNHGWTMSSEDQTMEFYHLANMTSGYMRPEYPGSAWAYNDYAMSLYAWTLFDNVYGTAHTSAAANAVVTDASHLGPLQFQDGDIIGPRWNGFPYALVTTPRDFARLGWFWLNKGNWDGVQLLPQHYFDDYMRAQVPSSMPRTSGSEGSDYLGVGSMGGDTDQTQYGPGVYGCNWWCNDDVVNWPSAPSDTVQCNGHWGPEVLTVIPSRSVVLATIGGNMGAHATGQYDTMDTNLALLTEACPEPAGGYIIVDPTNPARMVYSNTYESGHLKPVCFAGPGDPEDFFYNDTTNNLNLLTSRGARCTYITAVLQDFGGGNPGTGTALDTKLDEWEGYITQLENAEIGRASGRERV